MFISISQKVDTDNDYSRVRCSYNPQVGEHQPARIHVSFGYGNALLFSIHEARTLALELEAALRDAWSDDAEGIA